MPSRKFVPASVVAVAALSLLTAGCGGSKSSPTAGPTTQNGALAYARCMRSHGVPNFPDPSAGVGKSAIISALKAVGNSQGQAAQKDCENVNGGTPGTDGSTQSQPRPTAILAFARCMRSHGFPNFPDPTSSGQLTHQMLAGAGIDLQQPAVLHAGDACTSVTHGAITKATVARFVAGQ